jgi:RNA polymerase sigma-70 factor (ECF subfamily)
MRERVDDRALIQSLAADLDRNFEHLVVSYGPRMYRFALRSGARSEDAEEIAQDTFIRAYRALREYGAERIEEMLLRPWLYRIALNIIRNRSRRRHLEVVPLDGHDGIGESHEGVPERSLEATERKREMEALLARLPERYRVPVVLRHVEGVGYGEMAEILGQPVGTVKSNVHRGIGMLRDMIGEEVMA